MDFDGSDEDHGFKRDEGTSTNLVEQLEDRVETLECYIAALNMILEEEETPKGYDSVLISLERIFKSEMGEKKEILESYRGSLREKSLEELEEISASIREDSSSASTEELSENSDVGDSSSEAEDLLVSEELEEKIQEIVKNTEGGRKSVQSKLQQELKGFTFKVRQHCDEVLVVEKGSGKKVPVKVD